MADLLRVPITSPFERIEWQPNRPQMAELLSHIRQAWTKLGESKPHWSVRSAERFLPENIAATGDAFFQTGLDDVLVIERTLQRVGRQISGAHAFEYGCGLGRVTVPLSLKVDRLTACDISPSHLALAAAHIEKSGARNVKFVQVNSHDDFGMTEPFDLWYSRIVLQHNPPPIISAILRRALKMLSPSGIALFQVPTYALNYKFETQAYLDNMRDGDSIEMHCLPQSAVFSIAREEGCFPLEVREDDSVGHQQAWVSNQFVFQKG